MKLNLKTTFWILLTLLLICNVFALSSTSLRVQMYNGNTAPEINTIFPWFKITNISENPIDLATVKIRYFYTIDGEKPQNFWCDWSTIGSQNVTGTFTKLASPFTGADYYFELGFKSSAGMIRPGQVVEVHNRFAKTDWSNYRQNNDYSFNPTAKTYADSNKITVVIGDGGSAPKTTSDYTNDGKWVKGPVAIHLTVSGATGATTYYRINDGTIVTGNVIQLSQDGVYTISFWSVDQTGIAETPQRLKVLIDQTGPALTASQSPAKNAYGWNNTNVTVTFNAGDLLSGVKTVSPPVVVEEVGLERTVRGVAMDQVGNESSLAYIVNIDKTAPEITHLQPQSVTNNAQPTITANIADDLSGLDPAAVVLKVDNGVIAGNQLVLNDWNISYTPAIKLADGNHTVTLSVKDKAGNGPVVAQTTFTVDANLPPLPPDPATVAPPLDNTQTTDLGSATKFLYAGDNPIQTGVAPDTIEPRRAAVLRGKVLDIAGNPLPGVTVRILEHPEYGQTVSRLDGMFDLAVNGGGAMTLKYDRNGYLSAQRQLNVPWQNYTLAPDVVLIKQDPQVTAVGLNQSSVQVARSSVVTDKDGSRRATIIFPSGTQVAGYSGDTLHIRATEYTVGENGPKAMPAELPATTAYTYCVEVQADEQEHTQFNQPVFYYLENFLNFPVGCIVPVGYYDKAQARWLPTDNGCVIKIVNVTDGQAEVAVDNSGQVAGTEALAEMRFTDEELQQLAALYAPGQSLWRVPMRHFSIYDCNYGVSAPNGATDPNQPNPQGESDCDDPNTGCGSIIDIENQKLGEAIGITGTPYSLYYSSDRVQGRAAANTLQVSLSSQSVPTVLKKIILDICVAGQSISKEFPAAPGQKYVLEWDGKDAYGRKLQGKQAVTTSIRYVYDGYYNLPPSMSESFGYPSGVRVPGDIMARNEVVLSQSSTTTISGPGFFDAKEQGLGGWSLNVHHSYDPQSRTLYLGNGEKRNADDVNVAVIPFAGTGERWNEDNGDGRPATQASVYPKGLTFGPDGTLYLIDGYQLRRIDKNGIITTIAGSRGWDGYSGDGGPVSEARFSRPTGIAIDRFGQIYVSDYGYLRRISGDSIDLFLTFEEMFGWNHTLAMDNHTIYNSGSGQVIYRHKFSQTGEFQVVAGMMWEGGYAGDGGPASEGIFSTIAGITIGPNGDLYVADYFNNCIRRVTASGLIFTVAGIGEEDGGYDGDGGPATQAHLANPTSIVFGSDGSMYIDDAGNGKIRRVSPDGTISTYADFNNYDHYQTGCAVSDFSQLAMSPNGDLYLALGQADRILKITKPLPGFDGNDLAIPSEDGTELYKFNPNGKHLATYDTLTGLVKYSFNYDQSGYLISVVDADGNLTTIERYGANPSAIVGPYGQRTILSVNNDGYIDNITNPANETIRLTYFNGGLLASLTDPKGGIHQFDYDNLGLLTKDQDPVGGYTALERVELSNGYQIIKKVAADTNKENLTTYTVENLSNGDTRRTTIGCCGGKIENYIKADGSTKVTTADGTVTETTQAADPRFGMVAPYPSMITVTTPSGLTNTVTVNKTAVLSDPSNQLSLVSLHTETTVNEKTQVVEYDAATRQLVSTSPMGRKMVSTLDEKGRVMKVVTPGFAPVTFEYDDRGRLFRITEGTGNAARISAIYFKSNGYIDYVADPLNRKTYFEYDPVGRVTKQTLPNGKVIAFSYDANGNVTNLTPPDKGAHGFTYTAVDLADAYNPPMIDSGATTTQYDYNLAKQSKLVTRPDGKTIGFEYNTQGKLIGIQLPEGELTYAYDANTGQLRNIIAPDNGTLANAYDGALPTAVTWDGLVKGKIGVTYNSEFLVDSQSVNDANKVSYQYNNDGQLTNAGDLTINYDETTGVFTESTIGSIKDVVVSRTEFGEVKDYKVTKGGTNLFETQYTYDALGRIQRKIEIADGLNQTYEYRYDEIGQLTDVTKDGVKVGHYEYDSNGNRTSYSGVNGSVALTSYDAQDRLIQYGGNTYQYSANGELQSKTNSNGTTRYDYDVLGNLKAVMLADGTRLEYTVDGAGRRVGKKVNGVFVQGFLYQDDLKPVVELDGSNNVVTRFVYGTSTIVPDYMIKGGVTYRIVADHLGSPRLVVNVATGQVVQKIDYDEFGNVLQDTNPGFQPFGFAGGIWDPQTKLVRYGARDYDAEVGRWTCKDPIGFDGGDTDLFGYVGSDPINYTDPFGLAHFGRTNLPGIPWLPGASDNPVDNYFGTAISHEQLFFDDTNCGNNEKVKNIGFGPKKKYAFGPGKFLPNVNPDGYHMESKYYDDDIMRQAVENVNENWDMNYNVIWHNCQHYCNTLKTEYNRLEREKNNKK